MRKKQTYAEGTRLDHYKAVFRYWKAYTMTQQPGFFGHPSLGLTRREQKELQRFLAVEVA